MKKLLLIDGHSLIHRAYHAYPRTLATAKGELTNAIYGFTNILLTAINELSPTHAAVAFDLPQPTFREQMFVGYKQSRVKPDDDMLVQIPRIKEIVAALNIPIYEVAGFEADDVIGTLANQAVNKINRKIDKQINRQIDDSSNNPLIHSSIYPFIKVVVLTSDRDLMQLIRDDSVVVKLPPRGKRQSAINNQQLTINNDLWNEQRFLSAWGFAPQLLPDYKALAGDQSDDIPGVKGIGEKTAKELVAEYGGIDDIYQLITQSSKLPPSLTIRLQVLFEHGSRLQAPPPASLREALRAGGAPATGGQARSALRRAGKAQNKNSKLKITDTLINKLAKGQEDAQLSKKLATIDTDVPIKIDWEKMEIHRYDKEKVLKIFEELQFKSLVKKLPNDRFEQEVQEALF